MLNSSPFQTHRLRSERTDVEEIGKCLPAVFKRHVRRDEPQFVEILAALWSRVVGKAIAEHSWPVAFRSGTLAIATPSNTWAAQLRELSGEMIGVTNAFLGGAVVKKLEVKFAPDVAHSKNEIRKSKIEPPNAGEFRASNFDFPSALDSETARILGRSYGKYFARGIKRPG